jgi:choline dehydrogenase-like flavoprotein
MPTSVYVFLKRVPGLFVRSDQFHYHGQRILCDSNDGIVNSQMPGGLFSIQNTSLDWCYDTVPQKGCNNRIISAPRGRFLGGCSAINGTYLVRGSKADYDRIADMGNPGWSWEEMLPFFKASETFHPAEWHQADLSAHGTDGPVHTEMHPLAPISEKVLESFIDKGFEYKPDMFVQGEYEGLLHSFSIMTLIPVFIRCWTWCSYSLQGYSKYQCGLYSWL